MFLSMDTKTQTANCSSFIYNLWTEAKPKKNLKIIIDITKHKYNFDKTKTVSNFFLFKFREILFAWAFTVKGSWFHVEG